MRLLLVEKLKSDQVQPLSAGHWVIDQANTVNEASSMLRHETYDLVLLNIVSLNQDGFGFIRSLRMARNDTPIVALTGNQVDDRTRALSLGADDAIAQPIDGNELQARITAVIRRHRGHSQSMLQIGDLSLCLDTQEVRFHNNLVHLTRKEYAVLELLMLRKGMTITKEMLLNHLYGGLDEPEMKIIDVFVCKLRSRLDRAGLKDVISTAWGRGYIMRDVSPLKQSPIAGPRENPPQQLVA